MPVHDSDIARRWREIVQINIAWDGRLEELYRYERETRNYELKHILGIVIFMLLTILIDRQLLIFD